ncbi:TonB-dependent receptor [Rhodanobacter sp. MP1X3]|uniref:TonB-dependent receptor n=1 Tax=Rhodanobacter sp. MP1X3 TaxID=2723086 RepID=UPI00160A3E65|nr:TonB-dependent receptor [Rhodanobacter sp. MP1X3]MBB6243551.1 iron complex outermembrane receptor protein [Rhodanobacter sp. MP1X3]
MKRISRTTLFKSTQLALCLAAALPLASRASDVTPAVSAPTTTGDATTDSTKKVQNLDAVKVTGAAVTVDQIAPTQGSMIAVQPQSIIGEQYLRENVATTGDYSDAISIAPSVSTVAPNGPGLMEAQSVTMRGFQDGQYNVTFDGIPWGDSNDFTHHSTSYFTTQDTGSIVVDRGPGTASTLGNATFGGTVAVGSRTPSDTFGIEPYLTYGSFGTWVEGAQLDTGVIQQTGGTTALINVENASSDGYLTYAGQRRQNIFAKVVQPIGDNTTLTFVGMYNKIHQNVPLGTTREEINTYGANYGLNNNPYSQDYYGYNFDDISTYMGYIALHSAFDGWTIDNKAYTYDYNHFGSNGEDPNGEYPNGTIYSPADVPGQRLRNTYTSWGDIFRLSKDLGPGELRTGFWYDHQRNLRTLYEVDDNLDYAFNAPSKLAATDRDQHNTLTTFQPYIEYNWNVTDQVSLTGGVKYADFKRGIDAAVNQGTLQPLQYSKDYNKLLPSLALHWQLSDDWTAYAQIAKGFLAPNLNTLYTIAPQDNTVKPEQTINKQLGTTWTDGRLTLSADGYYINFNNKIESRTIGAITTFYNAGGAVYKGLEAEGTYLLGDGFSVYANGSLNRAIDNATNQWLPDAPHKTAALGLIYSSGPLYASLIDKFVGHRYGDTGLQQPFGGYALTNFAASYTFAEGFGALKSIKVGVQVNNIFDNKSIYYLSGYTVQDNTPLYFTIPERSYELTFSAKL